MSYELRPFSITDAATVCQWAASELDLEQLEPSASFPLTPDQIAAWTFEANYAFTIAYNGTLVGYGELIEDDVAGDIEIQHLLVEPEMRGQGIGKALIERLCAFITYGTAYREVWLRVGRDNYAGQLCATATDFAVDQIASGPRYIWYTKILQDTNEQ